MKKNTRRKSALIKNHNCQAEGQNNYFILNTAIFAQWNQYYSPYLTSLMKRPHFKSIYLFVFAVLVSAFYKF